jgi:hypothetical protein
MAPRVGGADGFAIATGSYEDIRDDWSAVLERVRAEGWRSVELTAITQERLQSLTALLDEPSWLAGFDRVSIHAPALAVSSRAGCVDALRAVTHDVVLHPDIYADESAVAELGPRALFENMDATKAFGTTVADLQEVFARFPEAGLCLDVAHVWTHDPTLTLGFDLLDALGDRLRQLHVSGIEPDGWHRPTTAADLALYEPLLERCRGVPRVLESLPAGA